MSYKTCNGITVLLVIEQILYCNICIILENATVNNPIPTFTNHILVSKAISGNSSSLSVYQWPQPKCETSGATILLSIPGLSITMTRPGNPLWVRNPVVFPNFDMNSVSPTNWVLFLLLKKQELLRSG